MKKKVSLLLCLVAAMLTMAACGTDPATVDYYGTTYTELQTDAVGIANALTASNEILTVTYSEANIAVPEELSEKLAEGWNTTVADLGTNQGLGELVVSKANGTVTVDQYVVFEGREVDIALVYNYDYELESLEMTDASVDLVYTLGEKMEKAALNTLMGLGTVFFVLILISLIIYAFRFISYFTDRKKAKEAPAEEKVVETAVVEETVATDDLELVAVITAAIAASEGTSAEGFVVRSIRRRF